MNYPSLFETVLDTTLEFEGGYVNDAVDPGGETCFGLTRKNYPALQLWSYLDSKKPLPKNARYWRVKELPQHLMSEVKKVYFAKYWTQNELSELTSSNLAALIFDFYVHSGNHAVRECCSVLRIPERRKVDVLFIDRANTSCSTAQDEKAICLNYLARRENFLDAFIKRKPEREKFRAGFVSRLNRLRKTLEFNE